MSQLLFAELARQFREDGAEARQVWVRNEDFATLDDKPEPLPEGTAIRFVISIVPDPSSEFEVSRYDRFYGVGLPEMLEEGDTNAVG